jgi:CBS domain containing-hemolysin-like protein
MKKNMNVFLNLKMRFFSLLRLHKKAKNFEELIHSHSQEHPIEDAEKELLLNVLALKHVTAHDIFTPRADIVFINKDIEEADLKNLLKNTGFSRFPVIKDVLDDVVGILDVRDLIRIDMAPVNLKKIIKEPFFIPPSMRILDLMIEMRDRGLHMAIVVDEYGGVDGLVTLDDIIEEIIGEIQDSEDRLVLQQIVQKSDNSYILSGRVSVEQFEEEVAPILIPEERREDIHTVGGLLFYLAGRIPTKGEVIQHGSGYEFEILEADARRIKRVCVKKLS